MCLKFYSNTSRDWARVCRIAWLSALIVLISIYAAIHIYVYPSHYAHWFTGADQGLYLKAARAWAAGDFDPRLHYYLPGYAVLAAPFVSVFPYQPFMIPDLLCLLVSFWLFVEICGRLLPDDEWAKLAGIAAFLVAILSSRYAITVWVVPLTTTGSAPFVLAALLGALRFAENPRLSTLFWTMAAGAVVAAFRPTDAMPILVTTSLYIGSVLARFRPDIRRIVLALAIMTLGVATPLVTLLAAHVAIHGQALGPYLEGSAAIGFQWRLIPYRWVYLVVDPRPLFPEGQGLARVFPWIVPGIAGMALGLFGRLRGRAAPHFLVIGTILIYWLLYLSYVDLQPYGLWRYYNYHYFKLGLPFFAFYAIVLAINFSRRRNWLSSTVVCAVVVLGLFFWRPEIRPRSPAAQAEASDSKIVLTRGLSEIGDVATLPVTANWRDLYFGDHKLTIEGRRFHNTVDFKVFPTPNGAMILPLRILPPGRAELSFAAEPNSAGGFSVDTTNPAWEARQHIIFAPPCLFAPLVQGCGPVSGEPLEGGSH